MSAQLYYPPFVPAFSLNGVALANSKLWFYYSQTTTAAPIYSDSGLTTPLANPVNANAGGKYPNIYLDSSIVYRVRQTDALGVSVGDDIDPYLAPVSMNYAGVGFPETYGALGFPLTEDWNSLSTAQQNVRIAQSSKNRLAIQACRDNNTITQLGNFRYYIDDTIQWNVSDKQLIGVGETYGGTAGSQLCIVGPNAPTNTVLEVGARSYTAVCRGQHVAKLSVNRIGASSPSSSGDASDCVKGILYRYTTNSVVENCRVFNSPVGFHVTTTATCGLYNCNVEPNTSSTSDISIGFLLGDYTAYPGFVGANGSLRVEGCTAFAFPSAAKYKAAFLLFGLIADTWMTAPEMSLGGIGYDVCGLDKPSMIDYIANGTGSRTVLTAGGSTQDVTIRDYRSDGCSKIGMFIHHLNPSTSINLHNCYDASSGTGLAVSAVSGRINLFGGEILASTSTQGGIDANTVGFLNIRGTYIRDKAVPIQVANCTGAYIDVDIYNPNNSATNAINIVNVSRSYISGVVKGSASKVTKGINIDSNTGYSEFNGSRIDPGCFTSVNAANKVWYNGGDGRSGMGTNLLSGVTG